MDIKCKLDAETKVTKQFRNPRAQGYSVLSKARVPRGFLNHLVTVGRGVTYYGFNYGNLFKVRALKV